MNRYILAGMVVAAVAAVVAALRSASSRSVKTDFVPQSVLDRLRAQSDLFDAGR